jgi:hypothetical protein
MIKIGLICDLSYSGHPEFKSFCYALTNLYHVPKIVKTIPDLQDLEILFIGDDHYYYHKVIWRQPRFIEYCNAHNIVVVVFTTEKIHDTIWAGNVENFEHLKQIKNLYHYTSDVDECELLGTRLHRITISRSVYPHSVNCKDKKDRAIFIGNTNCESYNERKAVLAEVGKIIDIDIIETKVPSWEDYMQFIAGYRFVFSPIGNANFFTMRFYETLAVKSIPIHQVRSNTLKYYNIESKFDDCIFFEEPKELPDKLKKFTQQISHNMFWMEDNLELLLQKDGLL